MSTKYPAAIDDFPEFFETSLEENSGQWWNEIADAIEAIEGELGINPQGTNDTLRTVIQSHFEADGDLSEFVNGVVTGTPTVASPVTITFGVAFISTPYVFAFANADMSAANQGVICAVHTRTNTDCKLVARRRDGTDHSSSRSYYWLAIDGSTETALS